MNDVRYRTTGGTPRPTSYVETTYHTHQPATVLGKARDTCCTTILGLIMIFATFPLLWWNEGSSLEVYHMLQEAQDNVQLYQPNQQLDPQYTSQLVWVSGTLEGSQLGDDDFGLEVQGVKLRRHVEMLQWVERAHSKTTDTGNGNKRTDTTYTYKEEWKSSLVHSDQFKDARYQGSNPSSMPFSPRTKTASTVRIRDFSLSNPLVNQLNSWQSVEALSDDNSRASQQVETRQVETRVAPDGAAYTKQEFQDYFGGLRQWDEAARTARVTHQQVETRPAPDGKMYTRDEFVDYFGGLREWEAAAGATNAKANPKSRGVSRGGTSVMVPSNYVLNGNTIQSYPARTHPEVGDVKIQFQMVPEQTVSVLAQQQGDGTLVEYTSQGKNGRTLGLVYEGVVSAKRMIDDQMSANTAATWGIRFAGYVLMFFGWALSLSWVNTIASVFDYVPLIGGLISGLVGLGTTLLSGVMTLSLCTFTIASAWLAVRPVLCLLVSAFIVVFLLLSSSVGTSLKSRLAIETNRPAIQTKPE